MEVDRFVRGRRKWKGEGTDEKWRAREAKGGSLLFPPDQGAFTVSFLPPPPSSPCLRTSLDVIQDIRTRWSGGFLGGCREEEGWMAEGFVMPPAALQALVPEENTKKKAVEARVQSIAVKQSRESSRAHPPQIGFQYMISSLGVDSLSFIRNTQRKHKKKKQTKTSSLISFHHLRLFLFFFFGVTYFRRPRFCSFAFFSFWNTS